MSLSLERKKQFKVAIVFRHGARTPNANALDVFKGHPVATQWEEGPAGQLTELGLQQTELLGQRLAQRLHHMVQESTVEPIQSARWFSSKQDRVVKSGVGFNRGFSKQYKALFSGFDDSKLAAPQQVEDPDRLFRPWTVDQAYLAAKERLRSGADRTVVEQAAKNQEEIESIRQLFQLAPLSEKPLQDALYEMTMMVELYECERYSTLPERTQLRKFIKEKDYEVCLSLALSVWNYRFFHIQGASTLAQPLVNHIEAGEGEENDALRIYSAHDYTILALLRCCGIKNYPDNLVGFCAHLILFLDPETRKIHQIQLFPQPFEQPAHWIEMPPIVYQTHQNKGPIARRFV